MHNVIFLSTARFTENTASYQTLISDTSGIISCGAEGTPHPWIIWGRRDGIQLNKGRFIPLPNGSLYVNPVHPQDKGRYVCTMKQNKGTDRVTSKDQTIEVFVTSE